MKSILINRSFNYLSYAFGHDHQIALAGLHSKAVNDRVNQQQYLAFPDLLLHKWFTVWVKGAVNCGLFIGHKSTLDVLALHLITNSYALNFYYLNQHLWHSLLLKVSSFDCLNAVSLEDRKLIVYVYEVQAFKFFQPNSFQGSHPHFMSLPWLKLVFERKPIMQDRNLIIFVLFLDHWPTVLL